MRLSRNRQKILKIVAEFFYGALLGIAFYELILVDLHFPPHICYSLGGVICLLLGVGNAISIQVRCMSVLAVTTFCGRTGRRVLRAIIIAYVVAGPVQNIMNNGHEIVRTFSCSASLNYNLTKTRLDLMFRPLAEGLLNLRADVNEVRDTVKSVKGVILPLVKEIEGEEEMMNVREQNDYIDELKENSSREKETKKRDEREVNEPDTTDYEKKYKERLRKECEGIINSSVGKCRKSFSDTYDKCYNAVSWAAAWLLCWPMKITFICDIVGAMGGKNLCDASDVVEPGFGEQYALLKRSSTTLDKGFKGVILQYKIPRITNPPNVQQAADAAKAVVMEFERKKVIVETILAIINGFLAFIFVRIIFGVQEYHNNYVSNIQFDNVYITHYFRRIDARRHKAGKHTLLPLKKVERGALINPYATLPTSRECTQVIYQSMKLILEMVTATTIILLDYMLYETLDLVRRHAYIEYTQEGSHDLALIVRGTGFIANTVRSLLGGFNIRERVKATYSNKACLPQPTMLGNYYYYKIYGTYLGIWLLILTDAYTQRIRRAICAYFYPKREKRRVLFLYNETLKQRIGLFKFMKARVKRMAREHRLEVQTNVLLVLRERLTKCCSWLKYFAAARHKCLICGEREPRKPRTTGNFVSCPNPKCSFVYCSECWKGVDQICYACTSPDQRSDGDDDDYVYDISEDK